MLEDKNDPEVVYIATTVVRRELVITGNVTHNYYKLEPLLNCECHF